MTQLSPTFTADDPFFAEDLQQMAKAANYRRWQFSVISPYLKGKVLEVGGGIGNFTADLARVAESVLSIEPSQHCYQQLVENTRSLPNVTTLNTTAEALLSHVPPGYQADTLVCMNVLEHIQDDAAAVDTFTRLLAKEGRLVLLVPAVPAAFGRIDQRLGHYRRYSKAGLAALMKAKGLAIERVGYFNLVGLLGWWWNARFGHRDKQSDSQIRFFDRLLVPWLSRFERLVPAPIGQSLLAVARRTGAS